MCRREVMYVDLNSCFATVEQQARPLLRYKPVAVTNRLVPNSCIIAASYEAKALGVKVGMRRCEATDLCPGLIFAETEPSKYVYVHQKFREILESYSSKVVMKSVDEGVVELSGAALGEERTAMEIGLEVKQRLREEIGCYMRCNVGLGPNRWLAKVAAELHKPDGLDRITVADLERVYSGLELLDLPGINVRMKRRLNAVGIWTPLEFYLAPEEVLVKMVCKSIDGTKWYKRLRGIEVDDFESEVQTVGRQYVLESRILSRGEVLKRILHLAEDVGYRLRSKGLYARGVQLFVTYYDARYQSEKILSQRAFNTDAEIMERAKRLYERVGEGVRMVSVTVYKVQREPSAEVSLFDGDVQRAERLCKAEDAVNKRFGPRTLHSAVTLGTEQIKTKIPFGSVRYLDRGIT